MRSNSRNVLGYELHGGEYPAAEVSHLLVNAPLKLDAGRVIPAISSDLCRLMGWPAGSRRGLLRRINRLREEIDAAVKDSLKRAQGGDLEGATDRLSVHRELWVGVLGLAEARTLIGELQAYLKAHRILDGYHGAVVSPEVAYLEIWHDR